MNRLRAIATLLTVLATLASIPTRGCAAPRKPAPKVVAYVPNWIDLNTFAPTIDYAKITHLLIAFENPVNEAGDFSYNPQNDVLQKQAQAHKVKVLLSIGGGAVSDDKKLLARYFDLISDGKRAAFVAKLTELVVQHNLDGVDVDLEGPAINKDYGAFVRDLAAALKPKKKLLTAALSQGYGGAGVPDAALTCLDFINVMAYNGTGPWNPDQPGQHASLEFAKANVAYWIGRGVKKESLVLGVPFYGYGFGAAFRSRNYPYKEVVAAYPGAEKADQVGDTIWYNGLPAITAKSRYVVEQGLGGVMIWSLDDDGAGERSLLSALYHTLHQKP